MPNAADVDRWVEMVNGRYQSYLNTSFYFKDHNLRESFRNALETDGALFKGPFSESNREFALGSNPRELASQYFSGDSQYVSPALIDAPLYAHQENAIVGVHAEQRNTVVATGTASGKTECFIYPILFELFQQNLQSTLKEQGVRALILYPMNALANDQRERLGDICERLKEAGSTFAPTFGQYIGQTPEDRFDHRRNAAGREEDRYVGEMVFREEMRNNPPNILLTNYSMLEYLPIRPDDSPLFDGGRGCQWEFIVLDEAHQYRGAKGMEMGMLVRRLKQRLREGGRKGGFRCIATSATIASGDSIREKTDVARFASELFGEQFSDQDVIFAKHEERPQSIQDTPRRYHAFLRALEGAFFVHENGKDSVVLNRTSISNNGRTDAVPLEIALCRECGQHYYVGQAVGGKLTEAVRDPSQVSYGVEYYLPNVTKNDATHVLCRSCASISVYAPNCGCNAPILVKKCESHDQNPDQLKRCYACDYNRGGIGDPVQEIVHGSDGPNAVIATALHELLPEQKRKVLAFADSRQEAAFFAWYAQESYIKLRDRNLILRSLQSVPIDSDGLSIEDLKNRLTGIWDKAGMFGASQTQENKEQTIMTSIFSELLTDERRLSLAGVGLVNWYVKVPNSLEYPGFLKSHPWNFDDSEARALLSYLLDMFRLRWAIALPDSPATPQWSEECPQRRQLAFSSSRPRRRQNVTEWGGKQSAVVKHFLHRILEQQGLPSREREKHAVGLMKGVWDAIRDHDRSTRSHEDELLSRTDINGTFRLNSGWIRVKSIEPEGIRVCDTCAGISSHNVRGICPRNECPGDLRDVDRGELSQNHYRALYMSSNLPSVYRAEEHTAQIDSEIARERQHEFKQGRIHLISSSTTFEVGVDLGDLDVVFLRNVPPEPFNYTQRVGRAGRRDDAGMALTYCRRNPHDLYHFADPERRVIQGEIHPPRLQMKNKEVIARHMTATTLSAFFKKPENSGRFKYMEDFVTDWYNPRAAKDVERFCMNDANVKESILATVPISMHAELGLRDDTWIERIAGDESRLARAINEVCADYATMEKMRVERFESRKGTNQVENRMRTIARESTLNFLSRKAVIPKYGFPVDVVELDTRPERNQSSGVTLQRDLSQAIAEYAPGAKIVANKLEWESCGVRTIPGKELPAKSYTYTNALDFHQSSDGGSEDQQLRKKYLQPIFGFVTPLFTKPGAPRGRSQRLYTTRPFFEGFTSPLASREEPTIISGVGVTKAMPGTLVILCEGKNSRGFYICRRCGTHMTDRKRSHRTPEKSECNHPLENFSLGHELVTDVVCLQFPELRNEWDAFSVAYAVVLGAAETMDVPETDLNVTLTRGATAQHASIVLYDNVPGGAGLVSQIETKDVFDLMIENALDRVAGACGCDSSCYGCLRSYRNQFAHPYLDRKRAEHFLRVLPHTRH